MKVANKLVNTLTALSFGSAAAMATTSAVYAADLPRGYQQQAGGFVQKSEDQCDETLHHMALRAKEARMTATEGDSFWGRFPTPFTTIDEGFIAKIHHVKGWDASGHYGCTHGQSVEAYKNENTPSLMYHVDALAGPVISGFFPMKIINNNNSNGGNQNQSSTIAGSTATTGPVTVTTGAVTANGGAGGNATAAAAAKSEATAKAAATATAITKVQQEWKKAHKGDMTGCGCGETNYGRPSHNGGSHGSQQTHYTPNS